MGKYGKPGGATSEGQGRVQRQVLGHKPLLEPVGGVPWGSPARVGLVNSNQKSGVW